MRQPFLFEDFEIVYVPASLEAAGKAVASKINKLRRQLSEPEKEHFDFYLAKTVREIKSVSSLSDDKQKNLVLTLIENCCHTWAEIEEDSHLSAARVREILLELQTDNLIFGRKRHTVGGSANQMLIYSRRKPCSCVR